MPHKYSCSKPWIKCDLCGEVRHRNKSNFYNAERTFKVMDSGCKLMRRNRVRVSQEDVHSISNQFSTSIITEMWVSYYSAESCYNYKVKPTGFVFIFIMSVTAFFMFTLFLYCDRKQRLSWAGYNVDGLAIVYDFSSRYFCIPDLHFNLLKKLLICILSIVVSSPTRV